MRAELPPWPLRYGAALFLVSLVILLRLAFWPVLGKELPFLFCWPAVVFSAWYGGLFPGLLTSGLCATSAVIFLFEPHLSLRILRADEMFGLIMFLSLGSAISLVVEQLHRAKGRAAGLADEADAQR